VAAAPVVALTSAGTIVLALAALGAFVYADRSEPNAGPAGAALVLLELESVWGGRPAAVDIAAALSATALLLASELRSWSHELGEAPAGAQALRAHAISLCRRFVVIALAVAVLVLLARTPVRHDLLAVAGSVAAVALFAGLLLKARRLARGRDEA
jgi:hypothetical protein